MTEPESPARWKSGGEVPPELVRALRVLGKEDVGSARIERVAGKLDALLDGAAPVPPAALLRQARRKLLLSRLAMATLAVGATAVWLARTPAAAPKHDASAQVALADRSQAPTLLPTAPVIPLAVEPTEPAHAVPADHGAPAQQSLARPESATALPRKSRARSAQTHSPSASVARAASPSAAWAPEVEPGPDQQPSVSASTIVKNAPPAPEVRLADSSAPRPKTEVELLFEARQQVRTHPAAALQLLEQLGERFSQSQLAPEREVLTIEALRRLGRTADAEQQLRSFRTRYPHSLHLRRLEQSKP